MRILYLTAHLSDVDVAQRALEKSASGPVRLDPCASVRDVARCPQRRRPMRSSRTSPPRTVMSRN